MYIHLTLYYWVHLHISLVNVSNVYAYLLCMLFHSYSCRTHIDITTIVWSNKCILACNVSSAYNTTKMLFKQHSIRCHAALPSLEALLPMQSCSFTHAPSTLRWLVQFRPCFMTLCDSLWRPTIPVKIISVHSRNMSLCTTAPCCCWATVQTRIPFFLHVALLTKALQLVPSVLAIVIFTFYVLLQLLCRSLL